MKLSGLGSVPATSSVCGLRAAELQAHHCLSSSKSRFPQMLRFLLLLLGILDFGLFVKEESLSVPI